MKNRFTFEFRRNGTWGERGDYGWSSHFYRRLTFSSYYSENWALPRSVRDTLECYANLRHDEWLSLGDPYRTTLGKIVFKLEVNDSGNFKLEMKDSGNEND